MMRAGWAGCGDIVRWVVRCGEGEGGSPLVLGKMGIKGRCLAMLARGAERVGRRRCWDEGYGKRVSDDAVKQTQYLRAFAE